MLTREELEAQVRSGAIETVILGFTDHYGKLCGKRFDAEFFLRTGETGCCSYLLASDIVRGLVDGLLRGSGTRFFVRLADGASHVCRT
jgi:glutamine synthetase